MLIPILLEAAALTAGAAATLSPAPLAQADTFAIKASHVHVGDGTSMEGGYVVVSEGVVRSVGVEAPDGVRVIEVEGHVTPGLIALRDSTGAGRENNERTRKVTPTADLSLAFDPDHPGWKSLVQQGVTAVVLSPDSSRIAGGVSAVVSPASGEVIARGALVALGMSSRSLSTSEAPTSYAGLYQRLEEAFGQAEAGSPLARAKAGEVPVLMEATDRAEVLHAIEFAGRHGLVGAVLGLRRADGLVDALQESGLGVVFEPVGAGASRVTFDAAVALHEAGVPFAFAADAAERGPAALRMTAAAFVRAGVPADAGLIALTSGAADLAGVGRTHGTIAPGKVADLVVWSGHPTDLTSRVRHVFAAGRHVHDAEDTEEAR